jgi:predicted transcriptional regulator of viral defense system
MKHTPLSIPKGRQKLADVVQAAGDVISVDDAASALDMDRVDAAKMLSRWTGQGWLRRVGRGLYVPVSLDTLNSTNVLNDPWVMVPALFEPAYIGGRTAAEHWDLTEQIFNDIFVFTTRSIRQKAQTHHGANFSLKHISDDKMFGIKPIWRARSRVQISDVHRTIIDMLDDPSTGGGIQQVADCLGEYSRRPDRSDKQLVEYAEQLGNGAVFKRLGFLSEQLSQAEWLTAECAARLTAGNAKLDPALDCPRMITRWNPLLPKFWKAGQRQ